MTPFDYSRAGTVGEAVEVSRSPRTHVLAGGTNLVDLMRDYVRVPGRVVDIARLDLASIAETAEGGLRIGALATNTAIADHPIVRERYAALSEAILHGASQQIRNRATAAGNILQSVRCPYYWDTSYACNRRDPDSGCAAIGHPTRYHAVLGVNEACIAANPSDMAAGLAIYDPLIEIEGLEGARSVAFAAFHNPPGDDPSDETVLANGDVVTAIVLPPAPEGRSGYLKMRERHSYAYALVSLAVHRGPGGVRVAFGSTGSVPWRASRAEAVLNEGSAPLDRVDAAVDAEFADASEPKALAFKRPMAKGGLAAILKTLGA